MMEKFFNVHLFAGVTSGKLQNQHCIIIIHFSSAFLSTFTRVIDMNLARVLHLFTHVSKFKTQNLFRNCRFGSWESKLSSRKYRFYLGVEKVKTLISQDTLWRFGFIAPHLLDVIISVVLHFWLVTSFRMYTKLA